MANVVEIVVKSKDQSGPGLASGERNLDAFAKTGVKAGDAVAGSMEKMADKVTVAQKRVSAALDAEAESLAEVMRASDQVDFERISGDTDKLTAAQKRLDEALRKQAKASKDAESAAASLGQAQAQAAKAADKAAADAGKKPFLELGGKKFSESMVAGIAAGGPLVAAVGAAVGAAGAGAVVTGFGAGIAGLGLTIAANSGPVKGSIEKFKAEIGADMSRISAPFQQTWAVILDQGEKTFDKFRPALEKSMGDLAPVMSRFVARLGQGFAQLVPAIAPITRAFSKVLDDLGPRMPQVIGGIEKSLTRLASSIERNPQAFGDFISIVGKAIELVLNFGMAVNEANAIVHKAWDFVTLKQFRGEAEGATGAVEGLDGAQLKAKQSAADMAEAERAAKDAAAALADAIRDLTDATYANIGGELARKAAVDASDEALKTYTEAVRDHGAKSEEASDALLGVEQAALAVAEATYNAALAQQTASGQAQNSVAAQTAARDALMNMAAHAKGPARDTILAQADAVQQLINKLNAVNRTFNAKVMISYQGTVPQGFQAASGRTGLAHGGITGAAGGGPRSRQTLVGEHGPEIVDLAPGSTVHTAGETQRMLSQGGTGGFTLTELVLPRGSIEALLVEILQKAIQDRGGMGRVFVA